MNLDKLFEILGRLDRYLGPGGKECEKEIFIRRLWNQYLKRENLTFRVTETYNTGRVKYDDDNWEGKAGIAKRYRYVLITSLRFSLSTDDSLTVEFIDAVCCNAINRVVLNFDAIKMLDVQPISYDCFSELVDMFCVTVGDIEYISNYKAKKIYPRIEIVNLYKA